MTASVTGTGNLVPMTQSNVNFKVSGILTEIDVTWAITSRPVRCWPRVDPTAQQQALAAAQANLARSRRPTCSPWRHR